MKLALKLFAIVALLAAPMFAVDQTSSLQSRAQFRAKMARVRTAVRRDAVTYERAAYRAKARARVAARRAKAKARNYRARARRQARHSRAI
jgi:hypothetical protein